MLDTVILQHKYDRDRLLAANTVPRELLAAARSQMPGTLVKVITGPRRAGKSVFALQLLKGRDFAYVNFDDERLAGLTDFDALIDRKSVV